jgi:hypothetical protein
VETDLAENLGGLEQRQAHHSRVAALEPADEDRCAPLDRIRPGLVERLTGGDVTLDLVVRNSAKAKSSGFPKRMGKGLLPL